MGSDLGSSAITVPVLAERRSRWIVIALTVGAALLYFGGVPNNPPGFYIDESSIAYNAHTIVQNGCDESGVAWPLYFRAFGDYKNPTYIYLLAALFRLTSPSILGARLCSAVVGVAAAGTIGALALKMTRNATVAWLAALSALLTPWLFETSRVVMEVALYPLVLGAFLLCVHRVSAEAKWSRLEIAALAATLALLTYTYSIGRLLGPLLAGGLAVLVTRDRWRSIVQTWIAYAITLVPLVIFNDTHPGALTERFKIITYLSPEIGLREKLFEFCRHYLANVSVRRMLVSGDPSRDQVAHVFGTPHFLVATFVLAAIGIVVVFWKQRATRWWWFVFYGLVVSVVPASLTNDRFHMLRLIALPIFLLVFAIAGLAWTIENSKRLTFVLLALTIAQAGALQWKFHHIDRSAKRLHLFDAEYRACIFAPAIASGAKPIYLADALSIPGYIQAYWYGTLAGIDPTRFVRLPADEPPALGALVISTEENCPRCAVRARVKPYTLYVANAPPRERVPLPKNGFRAEISIVAAPQKLHAKERATFHVRVKNTSDSTWLARERSGGKLQVSLGNHWLDQARQTVIADDGRSALLRDLAPGEETELRLTVNAPRRAGDYILELDMLQESVSWFGLKGSPTQQIKVRVD